MWISNQSNNNIVIRYTKTRHKNHFCVAEMERRRKQKKEYDGKLLGYCLFWLPHLYFFDVILRFCWVIVYYVMMNWTNFFHTIETKITYTTWRKLNISSVLYTLIIEKIRIRVYIERRTWKKSSNDSDFSLFFFLNIIKKKEEENLFIKVQTNKKREEGVVAGDFIYIQTDFGCYGKEGLKFNYKKYLELLFYSNDTCWYGFQIWF